MKTPAAFRPDGDEDLTKLEWQVYYLRLQCDDIRQEVDWIVAELRGEHRARIVLDLANDVVTEQSAPTGAAPP